MIDQAYIDKLETHGIPHNIDGEDMGDYIMLFDIYETGITYENRFSILQLFYSDMRPMFRLVDVFKTTIEKTMAFKVLRENNAEGVVFIKKDSVYVGGRPNSGGNRLKFKFRATASCIVSGVSDVKRSISLSLINEEGVPVDVGNCTVYPNQSIPEVGKVVEVKYLYAYKGGSIFQPVLIGERDDVDPEECTMTQLKYKKDGEQEE